MKVNFSSQFTDILSGNVIQEKGNVLTLASVCVLALMANNDQTNREDDGEQKVKDFMLSQKIVRGGEVEITVEEAARLKKRTGIFYGPMIVGQSWPLLDGSTADKAE